MSITQDIINHPAYIRRLREAGGRAMQEVQSAGTEAPPAEAGLFDYPEWAPDISYPAGEFFLYEGQVGFTRQAVTSQAHYPPFSPGLEAIYGIRPRMRPDGTYPYMYNMRSEVGMRIQSAKDGAVYVAKQPSDPLLYDPADVPALFDKEE